MTIEFSHKAKQLFLPFRLRVVDTSFQLDTLLTPNANCEKKTFFITVWQCGYLRQLQELSHTQKKEKKLIFYT